MNIEQLSVPSASVGTQVLVSASVGLFIAFAVQLLLTNLGLTLGITALKYLPQKKQEAKKSSESNANSSSSAIAKVSFFAGLGILLTLNVVLFISCFLAIRLSTASEPISGATLGIVIWSAYFLILIWVSSSAVSSIFGLILGSVSTGLRQLTGTIAKAIEGKESSPLLTEAAAAELIQQEVESALTNFDIQEPIEDYLKTLPSPNLDYDLVQEGFENFLAKQLDLSPLAKANLLEKIDRQSFIDIIDRNTNLSASEREKIVARLEGVWQKVIERNSDLDINTILLHFLQSTNPENLDLEEFGDRLQELLERDKDSSSGALSSRFGQINWGQIKKALLNRIELSDLDLENIWQTLQSFYTKNFSESDEQKQVKLSNNIITNDIEYFLLNSPIWYLKTTKAKEDFKEVIYDRDADPQIVRSQLEQIKTDDLSTFLQQREELDAEEIEQIIDNLENVIEEVISEIETSPSEISLSERVAKYLQTIDKEELFNNNLPEGLEKILLGSGVGIAVISQFVEGWQQIDWQKLLEARKDLAEDEIERAIKKLEKISDRLTKKNERFAR